MEVRITCINKDNGNHYNPHEAISHLGWMNENTKENGKCTRAQMVDFLEKVGNEAYTKDSSGNKAYLIVKRSYSGNKYVQTISNGKENDNLLSLVECN